MTEPDNIRQMRAKLRKIEGNRDLNALVKREIDQSYTQAQKRIPDDFQMRAPRLLEFLPVKYFHNGTLPGFPATEQDIQNWGLFY